MLPRACRDRAVSPKRVSALLLLSFGVPLGALGPSNPVYARVAAANRLRAAAYEFQVLTVPRAKQSTGISLNAHGDVTGTAITRTGTRRAEVPFLFRDGQYTTFNVPGADSTVPRSINDNGDVLGYYTANTDQHGFIYQAGTIITFDAPNAKDTDPWQINNSLEVAGSYQDRTSLSWHGFTFTSGKFALIDWPGASDTRLRSINDLGQVAGNYQIDFDSGHGFSNSNGFATFDCPAESPWIVTISINNLGSIMGQCGALDQSKLFIYVDGQMQTFSLEGAPYLNVKALNDRGEVTGEYRTRIRGRTHGFLFRHGRFFRVDVPGARATFPNDLNANGQIAGYYTDSSGRRHGFLATPK